MMNPTTSQQTRQNEDQMQMTPLTLNTYFLSVVPVAFDTESSYGHFGWASLDHKYLPYIIRNGVKYCAVRMVEIAVLAPYINTVKDDIYASCIHVPSYFVTQAEQKLLNEINQFHCNFQFGRKPFSHTDAVVSLSDVREFYTFIVFCYAKLFGLTESSSKCGFTSFDSSVVPYVVVYDKKHYPLFFFDKAECLQSKTKTLKGWQLPYLKFCIKIQGLRSEYFTRETIDVIAMDDVVPCLPPETIIVEYCHTNMENLLGPSNTNIRKPWFSAPIYQEFTNSCLLTPVNQLHK